MVTSGTVLSLARCDGVAPGKHRHREGSTPWRKKEEKKGHGRGKE